MQELPSKLERLLTFHEESPNDTFVLFAIAKEYEKQALNENALSYYKRLLELDGDYVGCYYHLGKLYELLEQPNKAWNTYKQGMIVAKKVKDEHALNELAAAKLNLGDEEDFD